MQQKVSIANKNEVELLSTPSSVSLFTSDDLNRLGIKHLSDLFAHIPGFYSAYNAHESNESVLITRGHAQKYANTVLFLYNGHRINDDYTGGINFLIHFLNIAHVERIEVIRGPGSALYGSNAFNGVINIISKASDYAKFAVGSFAHRSVELGMQKQFQQWQFAFSGSYERNNGDKFTDVFDRFSLQNTTNDPFESTQIETSIRYQDFSLRSLYLNSEQQKYFVFRRLNDQYNKIHLEHYIHQFDYSLLSQGDLQLELSGKLQHAKRTSLGVLQPKGRSGFEKAPFLFGEYFKYRSHDLALSGDYRFSSANKLSAGIEWSESSIPTGALRSNYDLYGDFRLLNKLTVFDEPEQRIILDKKRVISSVYLQLASQLNQYISVTAGLRYDGYNDIADKLNPRLSIVYQPNNTHVLKLIYGQAYRVPSLGDLYDEESGLVLGNRSLKPTTLASTELSYQYNQADIFLGMTLFNNHIEQLIGFTGGNISRLDNIASNDAHGLETEFKWTANQQLLFSGHFTYLFSNHSNIVSESPLTPSEAITPKKYGKLSLQYQFNENWFTHLHWSWRDDITLLFSQHGSSLVNYAIDYRPNKGSQWRLAINNLFDQHYAYPSSSPIGTLNGVTYQQMPARGRKLNLSYHLKF
ncbi:TonB-dependent receptor [Thalassotalea sp. G2M2-11]|uniref:TonB-dependent receptor plug domain-containing protein n=1 Tax=Thalassotalea sp. G2M2-11 TaxID=2787627 RepID=UPI0019CFB4AB|nr:TonB-dependent receptor [Thalassotalea sp. G2M2-11]